VGGPEGPPTAYVVQAFRPAGRSYTYSRFNIAAADSSS
jgi:hypothetical protein